MGDLSFTEKALNLGWSRETINGILEDMRTDWADNVKLSYQNAADVERSLAAARTCFTKVCFQTTFKVPN